MTLQHISDKMNTNLERLPAFEATASNCIHIVGICIEIFGVFIIVAGIVWSTYLCVHWRTEVPHYDQYKIRIGRSLLLGLELLVAADIVKTIANSRLRAWVWRGWFWSAPF
jgi:uncharacterized membrane protein